MMTKSEALKLVKRLIRIAERSSAPDDVALRRIKEIVVELSNEGPQTAYFRENLDDFQRWVEHDSGVRKTVRPVEGIGHGRSRAISACWIMATVIERSSLPELE
jgi:hypothetical protein